MSSLERRVEWKARSLSRRSQWELEAPVERQWIEGTLCQQFRVQECLRGWPFPSLHPAWRGHGARFHQKEGWVAAPCPSCMPLYSLTSRSWLDQHQQEPLGGHKPASMGSPGNRRLLSKACNTVRPGLFELQSPPGWVLHVLSLGLRGILSSPVHCTC